MKIAIYSGSIPSSTFIERLINGVAHSGHKVFLFGKQIESYKPSHANIKVFASPSSKWAIPFDFLFWSFQLLIKSPLNLWSLFNIAIRTGEITNLRWWSNYLPVINHKPDVFHLQWAKSLDYWMPLQMIFNIPIVLSLRGAHINYSPLADTTLANAYKRNFPQIRAFHAVSEHIALEAQKYGAKQSDIKVIYSGLKKNAFKNHLKINHELSLPVRILSVGRDHWKKGYHFALLAIKELRDQGYNIQYEMIIGDASEALMFQIHDLNLGDIVTIHPHMPWDHILSKMQSSDVLLLSSVEEGIANVVLEAMMLGLPVVSSDCGGMNEILEDGRNGFIYNRWDFSDAVQKLKECLELLPNLRTELAQNARDFVLEGHNLNQKISEFISLYEQAFGPRS